jgi:hypothetical protein
VLVFHHDLEGLVVVALRQPRLPEIKATIEPFKSRHHAWLAFQPSVKFELLEPPLKVRHILS